MEENKCCENCSYKKCAPLKVIGIIVLLAVAFYIGTLVGPLDFTFLNDIDEQQENLQTGSASVTIEVAPNINADKNIPPVLE